MDFIIGLAHWCEIHGPSSILCTQVIPPACGECYPPLSALARSPSSPQLTPGPTTTTPPHSSHGYARANTTSNTPIGSPSPRPATAVHTTRYPSPIETPPGSPGSPTVSAAPNPAPTSSPALPDTCRNCTITLPAEVNEKVSAAGRGTSPPRAGRPLRTYETIVVGSDERKARGQSPMSPKFQPQFSATPQSLTAHTHTVTYLSSRAPVQASRYSHVRQACLRSFTGELAPAPTDPLLFGDDQTGYTMAVVFKLSDAKARGGRRTYALMCMSMSQKLLVQSWSVIRTVFEGLVNDIQRSASEQAAKDAATACDGPEGFLRRRVPGSGESQKSLADLVGKDRFFVDIHSAFTHLLAGLTKIYGYGSPETEPQLQPLSLGAAAVEGRNRAGSIRMQHAAENQKVLTMPTKCEDTGIDARGRVTA